MFYLCWSWGYIWSIQLRFKPRKNKMSSGTIGSDPPDFSLLLCWYAALGTQALLIQRLWEAQPQHQPRNLAASVGLNRPIVRHREGVVYPGYAAYRKTSDQGNPGSTPHTLQSRWCPLSAVVHKMRRLFTSGNVCVVMAVVSESCLSPYWAHGSLYRGWDHDAVCCDTILVGRDLVSVPIY